MNIIRKIGICLFAYTTCISVNAQSVYYVTDVVLGNSSGSLDNVINSAKASANLGESVTVYFEAPGLCQITASLPVININAGSIIFIKSPSTITEQGIEFAADANNTTINYGFNLSNTSPNTIVQFMDLTVKGFVQSNSLTSRRGIFVNNSDNVKIAGCSFVTNHASIEVNRCKNLIIDNNQFSDIKYSGVLVLELFPDQPIFYNSLITNNEFSSNGAYSESNINVGIIVQRGGARGDMNHEVIIENNIINSILYGIYIQTLSFPPSNLLSDPSFKVTINNNVIEHSPLSEDGSGLTGVNLTFLWPYRHFIVRNNQLINSKNGTQISLNATLENLPNEFGLDFIEENSFGLPENNTGNVFSSSNTLGNERSFIVAGEWSLPIHLVGLTLNEHIEIYRGFPTIVRENEIIANRGGLADEKPIFHSFGDFSNFGISPPTINEVVKSGNNVNVKYELNGIEHVQDNSPFVVEFFKSNSNGDLVQFLGNHTVSAITGGEYSAGFNLPSGVTLDQTDRIAATVTAYGNRHVSGSAMGTSEVSFFNDITVTNPPPTNTDCSASIAICKSASGSTTSHTFSNFSSDDPCVSGTGFIKLFYTMYLGSTGSYNLNFTGTMLGYELYGPLTSNLPDACEQYTQNIATLISSSSVPATDYPIDSNPTSSFQAGYYLIVVKIDQCANGTISFLPPLHGGNVSKTLLCEPDDPCPDCVPSFELESEKKYIISAWVKEDGALPEVTTYSDPTVVLTFGINTTPVTIDVLPAFIPKGVIIDGWQRIEGEFTVPANCLGMQIKLEVLNGKTAYYDDIRIFPFNGSMKSYVYDPITLRLMAELDERNYATIYEYDEEGKLVRVKKETERGVMTIQENKTFIKKKTEEE